MCVSQSVCVTVAERRFTPNDRSSSNSISRVLLQISLAVFLVSPTLKLRVVHIRKNKKSTFSKMAITILIKILWVYRTFEPQQYDNIGFTRKNP